MVKFQLLRKLTNIKLAKDSFELSRKNHIGNDKISLFYRLFSKKKITKKIQERNHNRREKMTKFLAFLQFISSEIFSKN